MADGDCFELLYNSDRAQRALILDTVAPGCACSNCAFGALGPVNSNEILGRFVSAPMHTHKHRHHVDHRVFTHAERHGMSVIREASASDEEVRHLAEELFPADRRSFDEKFGLSGVILFQAGTVLELFPPENSSVYCLYGTSKNDFLGHGDVFQRVCGVDEDRKMHRRIWLFEKVKEGFQAVDNYRNGLLVDLKPKIP